MIELKILQNIMNINNVYFILYNNIDIDFIFKL